ncbi:glycosyltransferase [Pontibacter rugosus]
MHFSGTPLPWKGIQIGLQAFAEARLTGSEYWVVATKRERGWLENLAAELGITHKVKFFGDLPSIEDVHKLVASADVFVHMATHEAYGNVVMEAMALGKPVMCFNNGGPALQVNNKSGWVTDFTSAKDVTQQLVRTMQEIEADKSIAVQKGTEAVKQVTYRCQHVPSGVAFLQSAYQEAISKKNHQRVSDSLSIVS